MTGFGVPNSTAGGTTPVDLQRIIAAEYANAGIIDGCDVTGTTGWGYKVTGGAVIMDTGTDLAIKVPVEPQTVPCSPAPATGSRTDTIYVRQMFPVSGNPDNSCFVGVTSGVAPANSYILSKRIVRAGMTSTSTTTEEWNRKFARPVGGTLGRQHMHIEKNGTPRTTGTFTRGAGSFYLPTDRDLEIRLNSCVSASDTAGHSVDGAGSVLYQVYMDNVLQVTWERAYARAWENKVFSHIVAAGEGSHTIHYTVKHSTWTAQGAGRWAVRYGGANKFSGDDFRVYDRGVITW